MTEKETPPGLIIHSIPNTAATHEDESMLHVRTHPGFVIQSPPDTAGEHEDETMSDPIPARVDAAVYGYQTLKPISQAAPTDTRLVQHRLSVTSRQEEFRKTRIRLNRPKEGDNKVWYCCACNGGPTLTAINEGCSYCCNHWRCSRCLSLENLHWRLISE